MVDYRDSSFVAHRSDGCGGERKFTNLNSRNRHSAYDGLRGYWAPGITKESEVGRIRASSWVSNRQRSHGSAFFYSGEYISIAL
jgi:hypothetical protein